jgi:hypothetical protein
MQLIGEVYDILKVSLFVLNEIKKSLPSNAKYVVMICSKLIRAFSILERGRNE